MVSKFVRYSLSYVFFDCQIVIPQFFIVENGGAGEFRADPSQGTASAFRFDQSQRAVT